MRMSLLTLKRGARISLFNINRTGNSEMTDYVTAYNNPGSMYHREAVRLADSLRTDATIRFGIIRWNSNDSVVPADCAALAVHIGLMVNTAACDEARSLDQQAFFASYRKARANGPSAEERMEARAAMGAGVEMVDIITGHKWRT
jgi:hypothetical protein